MKRQFLNKLSYLNMKWTSLKKRITKREKNCNKLFDWLINYVLNPIKIATDFKNKILSFYNSKTNK